MNLAFNIDHEWPTNHFLLFQTVLFFSGNPRRFKKLERSLIFGIFAFGISENTRLLFGQINFLEIIISLYYNWVYITKLRRYDSIVKVIDNTSIYTSTSDP